jgi:uncharacterized lipoprotein YmbA
MYSNNVRITAVILMLAGLAGCAGTSTPARFYLLEPMKESAVSATVEETDAPVVVVGPVRIPKYADRPQIVTAVGSNSYRMDEFHRWAERLDENVARVLVQDLSILLPSSRIVLGTTGTQKNASLRISVNILDFFVDPEGQARLVAQWSVVRNGETVLAEKSAYRIPASKTDYQTMVGALNDGLNRLSRDMAEGLRRGI